MKSWFFLRCMAASFTACVFWWCFGLSQPFCFFCFFVTFYCLLLAYCLILRLVVMCIAACQMPAGTCFGVLPDLAVHSLPRAVVVMKLVCVLQNEQSKQIVDIIV